MYDFGITTTGDLQQNHTGLHGLKEVVVVLCREVGEPENLRGIDSYKRHFKAEGFARNGEG